MTKKLIRVIVLCTILLLMLATPALAQDGEMGGEVLFGQDLHLDSGEVILGDTVILGGSLDMAEGSRIDGDVVVFGGRVTVDGEITGDLAAIGGNLFLKSNALARGNVVNIGGTFDREEGATVKGETVQSSRFKFEDMALTMPKDFRHGPIEPSPARGFDLLGTLLHIVRAVTLAVVLGVVGLLAALLLPTHTEVVSNTILSAGWTSLGVGLLTLVVATSVMLFLIVTICLSPIGLLLGLALVVTSLFGWVVVGYMLGQRLMPLFKKQEPISPVLATLVGVFLLTLLQQGLMILSAIPCIGIFFWLLGAGIWLVAISIGLGATVLSRFGTQRYVVMNPHREPPTALPPQATSDAGPGIEVAEDTSEDQIGADSDKEDL